MDYAYIYACATNFFYDYVKFFMYVKHTSR